MDSDSKLRAIMTAQSSHRSSIHSTHKSVGYKESRFTPSNELEVNRANIMSAEKQPIRVQEAIPMAGDGRSEHQSSDYNSVMGGIDEQQLEEYLQEYIKEETVNAKMEKLKECVEKNVA